MATPLSALLEKLDRVEAALAGGGKFTVNGEDHTPSSVLVRARAWLRAAAAATVDASSATFQRDARAPSPAASRCLGGRTPTQGRPTPQLGAAAAE